MLNYLFRCSSSINVLDEIGIQLTEEKCIKHLHIHFKL